MSVERNDKPRSISIKAKYYWLLRDHCERTQTDMRSFVQGVIAQALGEPDEASAILEAQEDRVPVVGKPVVGNVVPPAVESSPVEPEKLPGYVPPITLF